MCWNKGGEIPARFRKNSRTEDEINMRKKALREKNAARNCNLINGMHRRLRKYASQIREEPRRGERENANGRRIGGQPGLCWGKKKGKVKIAQQRQWGKNY